MQSFNLHTSIHFGADALSRLATLEYKNVFIVADPFIVSGGLIKNVTKYLDAAGAKYTIYSDVAPDPSVEKVGAGVTALLRDKAPCIITVGGGSAIDLTKCIRQFANQIEPTYFP
ncbi:MAG: iron-containing alcohol dehydrogenase, partial [Clostridia bacterium]|nr:iron-containing alcohol dehydrogenase [Clostridia bacterium]